MDVPQGAQILFNQEENKEALLNLSTEEMTSSISDYKKHTMDTINK